MQQTQSSQIRWLTFTSIVLSSSMKNGPSARLECASVLETPAAKKKTKKKTLNLKILKNLKKNLKHCFKLLPSRPTACRKPHCWRSVTVLEFMLSLSLKLLGYISGKQAGSTLTKWCSFRKQDKSSFIGAWALRGKPNSAGFIGYKHYSTTLEQEIM